MARSLLRWCRRVVRPGDHQGRRGDPAEVCAQIGSGQCLAALGITVRVDGRLHGLQSREQLRVAGREPGGDPQPLRDVRDRSHAARAHRGRAVVPAARGRQMRGGTQHGQAATRCGWWIASQRAVIPPSDRPARCARSTSSRSSTSRTSAPRSARVHGVPGGLGGDSPCPRVSTRITRSCSDSAPTQGVHIAVDVPIELSRTSAGASAGPSSRQRSLIGAVRPDSGRPGRRRGRFRRRRRAPRGGWPSLRRRSAVRRANGAGGTRRRPWPAAGR